MGSRAPVAARLIVWPDLLRDKQRHTFHMRCAREHIDGRSLDKAVAKPGKTLDIPGQRSGVAGDIDNFPRRHAGNRLRQSLPQPLRGGSSTTTSGFKPRSRSRTAAVSASSQ